jgi:hypothetical protein
MYLQRDEEIANAIVEYSINQAHERLGHSHEDATRATAIVLGIKLKRGDYETMQSMRSSQSKTKEFEQG